MMQSGQNEKQGLFVLLIILFSTLLIAGSLFAAGVGFSPANQNNLTESIDTSPTLAEAETLPSTQTSIDFTATPSNTRTPTASPSPTQTLTQSPTTTVSQTEEQGTSSPTPCTPPSGWVVYTIQSGDTFYSLSRAYDIDPDDLMAANCMDRSTVLYSGTQIWVPNTPTITPTP